MPCVKKWRTVSKMTDMVWSDQELKYAAEQVVNAMFSSLPTPQEHEHLFTEDLYCDSTVYG